MPESALTELEAILAQAKKEKNSPQIIKATVYKMRFLLEKNPDEAVGLIKTFEASANECRDSVDKAVMHTMIAELYYKFYESDQYKINQRTEIEGVVPTDIKEWTKNIFFNKILEQLNLSVTDIALLQKTPTLRYADILEKGDDSRTMQPTLYDFLSYKRIELLKNFADDELKIKAPEAFLEDALSVVPVLDTNEVVIPDELNGVKHYILNAYNRIIDFNETKNNIPALVYAQLQKLNFEMPDHNERYLTRLDGLEKQFAGNEAVVEILAAKASYFLNKANLSTEKTDDKRKSYEIAAEGIRKYPEYKRIGILKNIQENILQKNVQTTFNKAVKPQSVLKIKLASQNLSVLQLSVYKINGTAVEYYTYLQNRRTDKSLYPNRTMVETRAVNIISDPNFEEVRSEIEIKTGDYGIYEFVLEEKGSKNDNEKAFGFFTVTDFAFIQRTSRENFSDIYVLDRIQGTPIKDVTLNTYDTKWDGNAYQINFQKKYQTDTNGYASLNFTVQDNDNLLFFEKGKDRFFTSQTYNSYWYSGTKTEKEVVNVALFTDRSLYRPGQALFFKGIVYISEKNKQEVVKNIVFDVKLYNANGEIVSKKDMKTNDFGSFAGEFVLPETGLNGAYRLECNGYSINVWVEEYKRPTFEVTVERPKTEVRFGEEVKVKGEVKAYAGYAIPDAQVKYRVVRRPHRFWWWHREPEQIIASGKTLSNADGVFEISFVPKKGNYTEISWLRGVNDQFYTYTVYADVTDPKGETQQGEQSVSVGDKSLFIISDIADKIERNKQLTLDVITQTLNGETVPSKIRYSVIKLQEPDVCYEELNDTMKLKELQTVLSGSLETKDKLVLDMKKLVSGMY
ncbi:MAG TPA: MG2 domain-containing protein, partial [Paludibacteraceae bacterium]|nr:MG2 domain-containing protein [Paludibacteraceae bacterium]